MSTSLQRIRSRIRHRDRGIANTFLVQFIKELWDGFGVFGYGVAVAGVFIASSFLFESLLGPTSGVFGSENVSTLGLLLATVYGSWIAFVSWEEYSDRTLSRSIVERSSIATVSDALELLQSTDEEARVNAAICLNAVVSTSPKNVVNTTAAPNEKIIQYLLPYLRDEIPEISTNIGNVVALLARDYPQSVTPYRSKLLDVAQDEELAGVVRGDMALAIGFHTLSTRDDTDGLHHKAIALSEDGNSDVRIGACYILAGLSETEAHRRLQDMAQEDPVQEVREHAEELV